jgi:hypothetical protein
MAWFTARLGSSSLSSSRYERSYKVLLQAYTYFLLSQCLSPSLGVGRVGGQGSSEGWDDLEEALRDKGKAADDEAHDLRVTRAALAEAYTPRMQHPRLFTRFDPQATLEPGLLKALGERRWGEVLQPVQGAEGVWALEKVFREEFVEALVQELDAAAQSGIAFTRPSEWIVRWLTQGGGV